MAPPVDSLQDPVRSVVAVGATGADAELPLQALQAATTMVARSVLNDRQSHYGSRGTWDFGGFGIASMPAQRFTVLNSSRPFAFRYRNSCVRYAAWPLTTRLVTRVPRDAFRPNMSASFRKSAAD